MNKSIFTCLILLMCFVSTVKAQPRPVLYKFNMQQFLNSNENILYKYDVLTFVSSLQGIVNRSESQLFINYSKNDHFWLNYMEENSELFRGRKMVQLNSFDKLLDVFGNDIKGIVLWDPEVPATSNVAATICGVSGWIPVRKNTTPGSLYDKIVLNGHKFPVKKDLTGMFTGTGLIPDSKTPSTGSSKCDAYIWAKQQYLDKGLCNDSLMGYTLDAWPWVKPLKTGNLNNTMVANHDYLIANKAFFFDLSPWGDEPPVDDKTQPPGSDLRTLKAILYSQYKSNGGNRITTICGFTPWEYKYTASSKEPSKHGAVETEWETVKIKSAYNVVLDADAPSPQDISNASIYQHFPLKKRYHQRIDASPKAQKGPNKNYILIYMGDYDGSAWTAGVLPQLWNDSARGSIPLMWGFNPNLSDRIPMVFDWIYKTQTENDYIVSGDSGAGYLNPSMLLRKKRKAVSGLPSGMNAWVRHNQYYFDKFDLSVVGFLINGNTRLNKKVQKAYVKFAETGVVYYTGGFPFVKNPNVKGVPFAPMTSDLPHDIDAAAKLIYSNTMNGNQANGKSKHTHFYVYRAIRISPSKIKAIIEKIQREKPECHYEIVDPYTFFYLFNQ